MRNETYHRRDMTKHDAKKGFHQIIYSSIKWRIELDDFHIFPSIYDIIWSFIFSRILFIFFFYPNIGYHPHKTQRPVVGSGGLSEAQVIAHTPWTTGALMEGSLWFTFEYGQWWYGYFSGEKGSFLSTCWHLDLWAVKFVSALKVGAWKALVVGFEWRVLAIR